MIVCSCLTPYHLSSAQAEDLLADCIEFLNSEAWYAHHGIPYRRGYLLYGSPGAQQGLFACTHAVIYMLS